MTPDVVILLCDTARADIFRPWGGPHPSPTIERLANEGTLYARATAPAPWTLPSHASMFSGRLPTEHGITGECFVWSNRRPSSPQRAVRSFPGPWLPEVMAERGYRTWGASCNSWISRWGGFDRGFEEFLDIRPWARPKSAVGGFMFRARRMMGFEDRGGRHAVAEFSRRLAEQGADPLFAFINLMETHAPFNPPGRCYPFPPWRRLKTFHLVGGPDQQLSYNTGVVDPGPEYVRTLRAIYYGCGRYVDAILGRLIQAIADRGRPTVVVIVADHGEHLGERGLFNHNSSLHQPLLHVPFLIWGSGVNLAGGVVEQPISTARLAEWVPSMADGHRDPVAPNGAVVSEYEGSVFHSGVPDHIRRAIEEKNLVVPSLVFHPGLAVRRGRLKYLASAGGDASLFDVEDDPGEQRDLLAAPLNPPTSFESDRLAWERRRSERPDYEAGEAADGEIAQHLRELGYIE